MPELLHDPRVVISLTLGLLFAGLLVDLTTTQELVVAIIFNIPIAASGLANSRRLTAWTVVLAVGANIAAAYENALVFSRYDEVALINRGLSTLSFLIVGGMTLLREGAVHEVEHLVAVREDAERERALRRFATGLSASRGPGDLVDRAAAALRELLQADAVVIATLRGERFDEPRWADGRADDLATPGELASWAVDAIPSNDVPAITVRSERGLITTGRWRRPDGRDLIVVADRPHAPKPSVLLGEALHGLVPLLEQAQHGGGSAASAPSG